MTLLLLLIGSAAAIGQVMIFGELIAAAIGAGGKKPIVPEAPSIDIDAELLETIQGNQAALPALERLTGDINRISGEQSEAALERALPGYKAIRDQITGVLSDQLQGRLPQDVEDYVRRVTGEKALAGGYGGSSFAGALTARDLGLTSLDITNRALSAAERWISSSAQRTPQFNFTSMFLSPTQRIAIQQWNEEQRFGVDLYRNKIAAMPDAMDQAVMNFSRNFDQFAWNVLSSYTGMAMGGGGGSGGMMGGGGGGGGNVAQPSAFGSGNYNYTGLQLRGMGY